MQAQLDGSASLARAAVFIRRKDGRSLISRVQWSRALARAYSRTCISKREGTYRERKRESQKKERTEEVKKSKMKTRSPPFTVVCDWRTIAMDTLHPSITIYPFPSSALDAWVAVRGTGPVEHSSTGPFFCFVFLLFLLLPIKVHWKNKTKIKSTCRCLSCVKTSVTAFPSRSVLVRTH